MKVRKYIYHFLDFNSYFSINIGIFKPKVALAKLNNIEYYEYPFYLKCKSCNNPPEIILNNNEDIMISCNKCGLYESEKIENILNYSSDWITNNIIIPCYRKHTYNDFKSNPKVLKYIINMVDRLSLLFLEKGKEGYIKIPSCKYCKTCNLYLCEECLRNHEKKKSHEFIELYNLKPNYCNKHNQKFVYYCHKCDKYLCNDCLKEHNYHFFEKPEKINKKLKNYPLENFIEDSEDMKSNKYAQVFTIIIWLQNFNKKYKESKKYLNNILNKIIQIFYDDLKTAINLVNFAKILFSTCKIFNEDNEIIKQYNTIIQILKKNFSLEKLKEFNELLLQEKNKYIAICNKLTKEETQQLKNNINKMFEKKKQYISDTEKTKDFIKDNMEYSSMIKRYVTKEKIEHPENYIDMDNTINHLDNFGKELNTNNDYVLSLLGKSVENNGIEMNVSKKKDENFDKIELASIQSIFTLSDHKKYELHFDFGDEENEKIIKDPYKKKEFLNKYKEKIAKELQIKAENIILTDVHHGSVGVDLSIVNQGKKGYKDVKKLEGKLNMKVKEKPLLETLQISPEILDERGNRKGNWGVNEKRGGEVYIPPLKGWEGIGLKVWGQYDNGSNDWLDYNNNRNEYAIAYYGLNNHLDDKNLMVSDLNIYANDIKKLTTDNFYQDQINERDKTNKGQKKCGEGICLYQDPIIAENTARIIEIPGYGISIKIILMCRVKPSKIRQPKSFSGFWILNPTPDEIRPYRILFKKITKSSLGDAKLKLSIDPVDFIINILNSNNFIFYEFAKDAKYHNLAYINGQKLNNDNFILRFYTSNYYSNLNNYLRDKKVEGFSEEQIKSFACCLQLALSRNKGVKENTIVYRGIRTFQFPKEIVKGSKFYLTEFMSTSTNIKVAQSFMGDRGTLMEIKIQNNNYLNYCYDVQKISCYPKEEEIIISSHCCFIVEQITRGELFDYVRLRCEGYKNK